MLGCALGGINDDGKDYPRAINIARDAAQRDDRSEKAMLFSGTARRVYRLA
jgi:hypothetical protein